jgi:hypothetical protein
MYGLTVRWSLERAGDDVAQQLRNYVTQTSLARFTGLDGLRFKLWQLREGRWFEGTYVFETAAARDAFRDDFAAQAATVPGSVMIGSAPAVIEDFEVVAVADGGSGFAAGPGPGIGTGPG